MPKRIYDVVYGTTLLELIQKINSDEWTRWKPLGGICEGKNGFYQTMVKR